MHAPYGDGLHDMAKAIGLSSGVASAWRRGRRKPSRAVRFIMELVNRHGLDALLSGELAQTPGLLAQDSTQVPKPKRTRKKRTK